MGQFTLYEKNVVRKWRRFEEKALPQPERKKESLPGSQRSKSGECGEDSRASGGLVSNFPHPRIEETKQHKERKFVACIPKFEKNYGTVQALPKNPK